MDLHFKHGDNFGQAIKTGNDKNFKQNTLLQIIALLCLMSTFP